MNTTTLNGVDPRGLDYPFRQRALELIKARFSDIATRTNNPTVHDTINAMASKLEAKIFEKATSRQDYVYKLEQKLANGIAASIAGIQQGNLLGEKTPSMLSAQYQQQSRVHIPATLSATQPANVAVHNQQFAQQNQQFAEQNQQQFAQQNQHFVQQNPQFGQLNVVHPEIQNPLFQPTSTLTQQHVTYQPSQQQYSVPLVSSQAQINQFQIAESPSTTGAPALIPISDHTNSNAEQFRLLRTQFHRARSAYLSQLHTWAKSLQAQYIRARNVSERDHFKSAVYHLTNLIRFLNSSEDQLMQLGNEKIRQYLNFIINYYNRTLSKRNNSAVNLQQFSSLQRLAGPNVTQNMQTAPSSINQPLVSPSNINSGFSNSYQGAANLTFQGSISTSEQMHMDSCLLQFGTQGSADLNTHKADQLTTQASQTAGEPAEIPRSVTLPEKRKHPMDTETENDLIDTTTNRVNNGLSEQPETRKVFTDATLKPSTNATTSRIVKKPKTQSSGNSHTSWLNLANIRSKKMSVPSKLCRSSPANSMQERGNTPLPSTPMTPTSVNSGVLDSPAGNNSSLEPRSMLDDLELLLRTPETMTGSPIVSEDCTVPESTTPIPSEKQPIDRLLDAVKSASKETLVSAMNDMRWAVTEMDELPDYAYVNDSDDDYEMFLKALDYDCEEQEHQQLQPNEKLKRDFETVSREASCPPYNFCTMTSHNPSSKSQSNRKLLDEITDTTQKHFWSVIKVVNDSCDQSNGSVVRVTYRPVGLRPDVLRSMFACESINLSIEFLVPSNYPSSPPKILGCKLPDSGIAIEMTESTKSLFDTQVRCVDSSSVGEMAEVWDHCARSVFVAYAKHCGGHTLISEYGDWESAQLDS